MARIKDQSVRDVIAAANIVDVVEPAHVAAQELRDALHGTLPVPRGAVAELLRQRRPEPVPLLRLRQGWRRRHVRPRDRGPRLRRRDRVARRAVPGPARVRGELTGSRRGAPPARAPLRGARPGGGVLRAPPLGRGRRRARACVPREPGARARRSRRSSGSASPRGTASPPRPGRRGSPRRSCGLPGSRTSAATTTSRRA